MFFLKELPARAMIENYSRQFKELDVDNVEKTLITLRNASLLLRELEDYFAQYGLSQLKFLILIVIDRELERTSLTSAEIADRIDVSKPVLSRTINKLLDDELLLVKADDCDGRVKHLSLSKQGKKALNTLLPDYYLLINRFNL